MPTAATSCRRSARRALTTPVIFLTARDALTDRLSGFAAGGDDYLTKPFAFAELVARLHALVKRGGSDLVAARRQPAARSGHARGLVRRRDDRPHADRVPPPRPPRREARDAVRRRQLVEAGWAHGAIVHDNTLDVYIARLRRKLEPLPGAPEIATVHGVGYSLR